MAFLKGDSAVGRFAQVRTGQTFSTEGHIEKFIATGCRICCTCLF